MPVPISTPQRAMSSLPNASGFLSLLSPACSSAFLPDTTVYLRQSS
jgi:hypothetical protein